IRHNAMPDHVHLLVRLPPTVGVSTFIGQATSTIKKRTTAAGGCLSCWRRRPTTATEVPMWKTRPLKGAGEKKRRFLIHSPRRERLG
ncbi:MAG: transposase, partial [Pirellulales bacterium]|nr:transposase [Pirellulales bacterium]